MEDWQGSKCNLVRTERYKKQTDARAQQTKFTTLHWSNNMSTVPLEQCRVNGFGPNQTIGECVAKKKKIETIEQALYMNEMVGQSSS